MSKVWSCNEWDQLEEVIVGNPLRARFPAADCSTQLAEFPDRAMMLDYMRSGARWFSAPKPMLLDSLFDFDLDKPTPLRLNGIQWR